VGLIAAWIFLPETSTRRPGASASGQNALAQEPAFKIRSFWSLIGKLDLTDLFKNRQANLALLLQCLARFLEDGVILSTVTLLLAERFGNTVSLGSWSLGIATVGGVAIAVRAILAAVSAPLAGRLSDGRLGRLPMIAISLLGGIFSLVLITLTSSTLALLLGLMLSALSGGYLVVVLTAYMGDQTPPEKQGMMMGAFATVGDIGGMIGPLVVFALMPLYGLKCIYLSCLVLEVIGLGLTLVPILFSAPRR
jgi:MFS family permease